MKRNKECIKSVIIDVTLIRCCYKQRYNFYRSSEVACIIKIIYRKSGALTSECSDNLVNYTENTEYLYIC